MEQRNGKKTAAVANGAERNPYSNSFNYTPTRNNPEFFSRLMQQQYSQVLLPQAACCALLLRSYHRSAAAGLHPGSPALCKQTSGTIPTSPLHSDLGEFTLGLHRNLCMQLVGRRRGFGHRSAGQAVALSFLKPRSNPSTGFTAVWMALSSFSAATTADLIFSASPPLLHRITS